MGRLEGRSRWIVPLDSTVEQGLTEGLFEESVVRSLAFPCEQLGIIVRCSHEGEYLSCLRLYGYDSATLALHHLFA